ncbi:MAG: glycoside hydrolase family 1 protein [Acidimicrobiales bacterium]|nr:glycoside hydrolase family 1 protein [Acidimicrobiales bacterium]
MGRLASAAVTQRSFPDGFTWGTATAAHQVEGGNWNNDWWAWEHDPASPCVEPSGDACDQYHRYRDDVALLAALGFGSYRFSIEWSRIEPEDGEVSRAALDHYRRVCAACKEHGLQAVVTLHHFTTPRWAADLGGWLSPDVGDRFVRFAEVAAEHLGDLVDRFCTFNEPNIVATMGYLAGVFPPGERSSDLRRRANDVFVDAHRRSVEAIRSVAPDVPAGLTLAMSDYQAVDGGDAYRDRIRRNMEDVYLEAAASDDFLGVQTYSRTRVGPGGTLGPEPGVETTLMGYEFWPEALEATIRRAWQVTDGTPLLVTENGIGTADDERRVVYVQRALEGVGRCLDDGIDVLGYTCWSLLDNFEWVLGYAPTFGIVAVDRTTQERQVKPSARWLGACARANALLPTP